MKANNELHASLREAVDKQLADLRNMINNYSVLDNKNIDSFMKSADQTIQLHSKFLTEDICNFYTKETLKASFLMEMKLKNKFYEAGISEIVKSQYSTPNFIHTNRLHPNQINNTYASLATAAGTSAVGAVVKYVLQNRIPIPIWVILIGGLIVGGVSYFSVIPSINKARQEKAIEEFFTELRAAWLDWLKQVEKSYIEEVEIFKKSIS